MLEMRRVALRHEVDKVFVVVHRVISRRAASLDDVFPEDEARAVFFDRPGRRAVEDAAALGNQEIGSNKVIFKIWLNKQTNSPPLVLDKGQLLFYQPCFKIKSYEYISTNFYHYFELQHIPCQSIKDKSMTNYTFKFVNLLQENSFNVI